MARVDTGNVSCETSEKNVKNTQKGIVVGGNNLKRTAMEAVEKGWNYAYAHRRVRKREYRRLWIARIKRGSKDARFTL